MNAIDGNIAPSPDLEGRAYRVNPTGPNVPKGTTIDVSFYTAIPAPTTPTTPTAPEEFSLAKGDRFTVSWPSYQGCPPGTVRTVYRADITGGTAGTANPIPGGQQEVEIIVDTPGTVTFSYLAECSGISSPSSELVTITITA